MCQGLADEPHRQQVCGMLDSLVMKARCAITYPNWNKEA
jgi:hypothetical protein